MTGMLSVTARSLTAGSALALIASAGLAVERPIDGVGNNVANPQWGANATVLLRGAPPEYADGVSAPAGASRLSPRAISNGCSAQGRTAVWNDRVLSTAFIFWGQFLDHDLDLSEPPASGAEPMMIPVPGDDPFFDPGVTPVLPFLRNEPAPGTGTGPDNPREQFNHITAFIDGSVVYGHTPARAQALRAFVDGKLLSFGDGLMPLTSMAPIAMANPFGLPPSQLFAAGDVRAAENPGLAVYHTIWVREHNRRAAELKALHPGWGDEQLFQESRLWVGSLIQHVTYNEFLPALLGPDALPPYQGYDDQVNPGIANEFAHAAYRFGHTMINPLLPRYDENGQVFGTGALDLLASFFNIAPVLEAGGVDALIRGMTRQAVQQTDMLVVDDLRNFLFPAGSGGLDLAAVNIQRGRDHGLASYNAHRVAYGLEPADGWADVSTKPAVQDALAALFDSPWDADLWLVGLAEDPLPGSSLGPLFTAIVSDQFTRLRDGDRFWYQLVHDTATLAEIESTTLAEVISRNSGVTLSQPSAFFLSVDLVANGTLNIDDLAAFINAYLANHPLADLTGDGAWNSDDLQIFIDAFFTHNGL